MASWMVHLRAADIAAKRFGLSGCEYDDFIIGNIAPDSGRLNDDGLTYTPPKSVTHYKTLSDGKYDIDRFVSEQLLIADKRSRMFRLGYYSHLLTDMEWVGRVLIPLKEKYSAEFAKDKRYIWQPKRDWYDLDKLFFRDNPKFEPMESLLRNRDYDYSAILFLEPELIRNTINRIVEYYAEPYSRVDGDEYVYMTNNEMSTFVDTVSTEIIRKLDGSFNFNR